MSFACNALLLTRLNMKSRLRYKVLSAGIFSLILTMGVARFSYTPLLPMSRPGWGWQKEAGWQR